MKVWRTDKIFFIFIQEHKKRWPLMLKLLFIIIKRVCLLLQTKSDSLNSISFKRNGELKQNPFLLLLDKSFWFHPTAKKEMK